MDINQLREYSVLLRAEVLRRKAAHQEADGDFSAWQAVVDIGYDWWRAPSRDGNVHYSDMIKHMYDAYGDIAALLVLLGKADQQICDGGVAQYFENGYATAGRAGCFDEKKNIDLHWELLRRYRKCFLGLGEKAERICQLLVDIEKRLLDHMDNVTEYLDNAGRDGDGEEPVLEADDLDERWYSEELDIEKTITGIVEQLFADPE